MEQLCRGINPSKVGCDVLSWRGPLVLSKYQGPGQLQHDALRGLVVLKAEICLATNPSR